MNFKRIFRFWKSGRYTTPKPLKHAYPTTSHSTMSGEQLLDVQFIAEDMARKTSSVIKQYTIRKEVLSIKNGEFLDLDFEQGSNGLRY